MHEAIDFEAVDVNRLVAEPIRDLFASQDREFLVRSVKGVQAVNAGEVVVVGQHNELIAVLPIPSNNIVRRRVTVAIQGVRVEVALEPPIRRPALSEASGRGRVEGGKRDDHRHGGDRGRIQSGPPA